jgi:hypothetical protein
VEDGEAVRSSELREMQRKIVSTAASWFRGSGWRASSGSAAWRCGKQARVCSAIGLRRPRQQRALWSRDLRRREIHDAATEVRCWVRGSDAGERQQQKGGAWLALARRTSSESTGDLDPWLRWYGRQRGKWSCGRWRRVEWMRMTCEL